MPRILLNDPRYYLNRHVQWLDFNRRVLEEARDPGNPLLERVKFLAITANNLDEFVEVRVSSFLQRIEHGSTERSADGLSTEEELAVVTREMHALVRDQYKCLNNELLPQLAKESIRVLRFSELDAKAEQFAKNFYNRRVAPMLTPVTGRSLASISTRVEQSAVHFVFVAAATRRKWQRVFWSGHGSTRPASSPVRSRAGQCDSLRPAAGDNLGVCAETLSRLRNSGIRGVSHHP